MDDQDVPREFLEHIDIEALLPIVVGAHPRAELHDRPTAYRLRARMIRWLRERHALAPGAGLEALAGVPVVVSDVWYLNDAALRQQPTICIGGPGDNALAAYLGDKIPSAFVIDDLLIVQLDVAFHELTACCWGVDAHATSAAVDAFCERYMSDFLEAATSGASDLAA